MIFIEIYMSFSLLKLTEKAAIEKPIIAPPITSVG